jgi:hypothetical protein
MAVLKKIMREWGSLEDALVFDTGFAGSIHRALCRASGMELGNLMLSTSLTNPDGKSCQIFPSHQGARAKALSIEYLPKYYRTGTVRDGEPVQFLSDLGEFLRAALLTVWIWKYKSSRFIPRVKRPRPAGRRRKHIFDLM